MCIGNPDGGDDAVGPYIADKLQNSDLLVINCGTTPENYTGVVKQNTPNTLVIIDAIDMGLTPGEIRIVSKNKISVFTVSTHGIPLSVLMNYLEQSVKKIMLIGIQPERMSGDMSDPVKKSANSLIEIIKKKNFSSIKTLA
jgi:hydrogenase 3 maturation protease